MNLLRISSIVFLFSSSILLSQAALSYKNSSYTYVKSNLEFLASDELEGRETTSRGAKLASLFISEELEKYGVLPYGDSGTYFQNFDMIVSSFAPESNFAIYNGEKDSNNFVNGAEINYSARSLPSKEYSNKKYEIIFAGYGIFSEDDNYDSYENIDVQGKVVLVINGTPKVNDEEILSEEIVQKYNRSTSAKAELASSKGAVGLVVLPDSNIIKYWQFISRMSTSKSFKLEEEIEKTEIKSIPIVLLNEKSANELLLNEESTFDTLKELTDPKPEPFELTSKIKFNFDLLIENKVARNIIGLIKGNNEKLSDEYLTIGAHYDHVGMNNGQVYNGADDNGSGTVTVLEIARKIALEKQNDRPILFIFHTGEEKGLKGAKYLTNNSNFIDSAIVHINIDMVGRESEDSIYCIGASKISKELGHLVEEVNSTSSKFVLDYKFDDPDDPQRLYYRSDHIHYANKGIPIAFFYDYMQKDYHKSSDTTEKINYMKIVKMVEFIENLLIKISNMDHKLSVEKQSL